MMSENVDIDHQRHGPRRRRQYTCSLKGILCACTHSSTYFCERESFAHKRTHAHYSTLVIFRAHSTRTHTNAHSNKSRHTLLCWQKACVSSIAHLPTAKFSWLLFAFCIAEGKHTHKGHNSASRASCAQSDHDRITRIDLTNQKNLKLMWHKVSHA